MQYGSGCKLQTQRVWQHTTGCSRWSCPNCWWEGHLLASQVCRLTPGAVLLAHAVSPLTVLHLSAWHLYVDTQQYAECKMSKLWASSVGFSSCCQWVCSCCCSTALVCYTDFRMLGLQVFTSKQATCQIKQIRFWSDCWVLIGDIWWGSSKDDFVTCSLLQPNLLATCYLYSRFAWGLLFKYRQEYK